MVGTINVLGINSLLLIYKCAPSQSTPFKQSATIKMYTVRYLCVQRKLESILCRCRQRISVTVSSFNRSLVRFGLLFLSSASVDFGKKINKWSILWVGAYYVDSRIDNEKLYTDFLCSETNTDVGVVSIFSGSTLIFIMIFSPAIGCSDLWTIVRLQQWACVGETDRPTAPFTKCQLWPAFVHRIDGIFVYIPDE